MGAPRNRVGGSRHAPSQQQAALVRVVADEVCEAAKDLATLALDWFVNGEPEPGGTESLLEDLRAALRHLSGQYGLRDMVIIRNLVEHAADESLALLAAKEVNDGFVPTEVFGVPASPQGQGRSSSGGPSSLVGGDRDLLERVSFAAHLAVWREVASLRQGHDKLYELLLSSTLRQQVATTSGVVEPGTAILSALCVATQLRLDQKRARKGGSRETTDAFLQGVMHSAFGWKLSGQDSLKKAAARARKRRAKP